MAGAVWEAMRDGHHLAVEAGTGTGKTLAYLLPTLLSGKRVILSTGTKALQDQLHGKDLPLLADCLRRPVKAVVVKGRENYLCRRRFGLFLLRPSSMPPNEGRYLEMISRWASETPAGDRAEMKDLPDDLVLWQDVNARSDLCRGPRCPHYDDDCTVSRLRRAAARADIVIVNHHLLVADAQCKDSGYGEVLPAAEVVVIDEAHLLEDVAAGHFGAKASLRRFEFFFRDLSRELEEAGLLDATWRGVLEGSLGAARAFFRSIRPGEPRTYLAPLVTDRVRETIAELRGSMEGISARLRLLGRTTEGMDQSGARLEGIVGELAFIMEEDESSSHVYWVEQSRSGPLLNASPLEVAPTLKAILFDAYRSVILTSATLAINGSFDFFLDRCGAAGAASLLLPSPFDYGRQTLLYLPTHLPEPLSPDFPRAASEEMERLVRLSGGRALLLFTSFRSLETAAALLEEGCPYPILVQGRGDRAGLLGKFRDDVDSILLGTRTFWQGIDVPGESLSLLVIDKLPFPSPADPLNDARARHAAEKGLNPFMDFSLPQAIIALRQGLGRLIRRGSDRGVMAVLDHRLMTRRYGRVIRRALPPCPVSHRIEDVAEFLQRPPDLV